MKKIFIPGLMVLCSVVEAQTTQQFDRIIDSNFKITEPGGVALVARKGRIVYERAFGMADLELNVTMQPDMVFRIASMTKQFTAIGILQLIEQGKLNFQDKICRYIDACPSAWQNITVEHLLTHTSGITDNRDQLQLQAFDQNEITPLELVNLFKANPLAFDPGTKWAYTNSGYMILGYLIEKVSGMAYGEYLDRHIFKPLEMTHSGYRGTTTSIVPGLVGNYRLFNNGFGNANMGYNLPFSAGGIYATVEDMLKWNQGLLDGKLVKKETLAKAWTSYMFVNGRPAHYGYGWQTDGQIQGSPVIEHSGTMPGFSTDGLYLPKEDIYVVVFMNRRDHGEGLPERIAGQLTEVVMGPRVDRKEISINTDSLKVYIGAYTTENSVVYDIFLDRNNLCCQKTGNNYTRFMLIPYAPDRFFSDNVEVTFTRDEHRQIIGFSATNTRHPGTVEAKRRN